MTACFALSASSASTMTQAHTGRRYCTSTAYLGIGFSPVGFPTPQPLPTSVSRGGGGSASSEGFQAELGEPFLAGGLVVDVVDEVILRAGDAEEMGEVVDH